MKLLDRLFNRGPEYTLEWHEHTEKCSQWSFGAGIYGDFYECEQWWEDRDAPGYWRKVWHRQGREWKKEKKRRHKEISGMLEGFGRWARRFG